MLMPRSRVRLGAGCLEVRKSRKEEAKMALNDKE